MLPAVPFQPLRKRRLRVLFRRTLKGFDIAVGDLDVGNVRALLHKLAQGLFPMGLLATMVTPPKTGEMTALCSGSHLSYNGREPD